MSIFDAINTAVVSALSAESVTCYPYESPALSKVPCATFVLDEFSPDEYGVDQGFGLGLLEYKLRYYVNLEKDARLAWRDLESGIDSVRQALGVDRTLGGVVREVDMTRGRIYQARTLEGGRRELVCEMDVTIRPKPAIG